MANKRMLSKEICESDPFLDLPPEAQCLYMHLNLYADDDGIIDNARSVLRSTGLSAEALDILLENGFLLKFKSGLYVITHWRLHNTIGKSRYKESNHTEEKNQLLLTANKSYSLLEGEPLDDTKIVKLFAENQSENGRRTSGEQTENKWRTNGEQVENPDKNSIDKSSIDIHTNKHENTNFFFYGEHEHVKLTLDQLAELSKEFGADRLECKVKRLDRRIEEQAVFYPDHYQTLKEWLIEDIQKEKDHLAAKANSG